jgi:hypothetical protein
MDKNEKDGKEFLDNVRKYNCVPKIYLSFYRVLSLLESICARAKIEKEVIRNYDIDAIVYHMQHAMDELDTLQTHLISERYYLESHFCRELTANLDFVMECTQWMPKPASEMRCRLERRVILFMCSECVEQENRGSGPVFFEKLKFNLTNCKRALKTLHENPTIAPPAANTFTVLDISIDHMPCATPYFGDRYYQFDEIGCWVAVTDEEYDVHDIKGEDSAWIVPVMRVARELGCSFVRFDPNSFTCNQLKTYGW